MLKSLYRRHAATLILAITLKGMTEKISSLIDNELEGEELERALARLRPGSPELEAWERYHRVRACMRLEFRSTIRVANDSEPGWV